MSRQADEGTLDFLDFLNRNSGAFNVIFAMVVAVATVFYAVLTRRLVSETQRMRLAQTEPLVSVRIESSEAWINLIILVVENVGPGPAYDVRLFVTPDFEMRHGQHLSDLGLFRHGLRHLAPHQRISLFLTSVSGQIDEIQKADSRYRFEVRATYRSILGTVHEDLYPIDFLHFVGLITVGTPPLQKMSRDIEKIRESIGRFESGWRKLAVDIFTASDRERERRDGESEVEELRSDESTVAAEPPEARADVTNKSARGDDATDE
ncbi:MAG: hypothetical protein KGJ40_03730 [candidate division NC10 bacterium]|nr:hypothetical protein [candidate division NC10 bacterium]MDE2483841.1 hypothetical protein [candidate division NC10 bacterium]